MISSDDVSYYLDIKSGKYLEFYDLYKAQDVKSVIYNEEEQAFYFLCNKMNGELGLYLYVIERKSPEKFRIITCMRNNLTIGDVGMFVSRGKGKDDLPFKELIVGFKTIFINTYTTIVLDFGEDIISGRQTLQKHEAFQLWES